jgi:separase
MIAELKTDFENVFKRSLPSQERRSKSQIRFDDTLVECFSALSPTCQDEEIEDMVYFILDLYQFHGVPVEISDVPLDLLIVELRMVLEQFAVRMEQRQVKAEEDGHMFLVLDRKVQGIPWESIPILRGRSVSRIPSMDFLLDRLKLATWAKDSSGGTVNRFEVNPRKTYYVLNPSGDLKGTEDRLKDWLKNMDSAGWEGVVGHPPSEQQFLDALSRKDLVMCVLHFSL